MKNITLSFVLFLSAFISTAQPTLVNDANAEKRTLNAGFKAIKISGGIDLYLSQHDTESMAVSATEPKYRDNIKTEVENGTLNIYYDSKAGWTKGNKKLKVYVSFTTLERLEANGACDVKVAGSISGHSLSLDMNGASDFNGAINVQWLTMQLSGASDAKINGTAKNVTIESSGASDCKAYDLITENCTAKASGASDINITVNNELNVHASGASEIFYKGTCVIKDLHTSGASTVSKKG